MMPPVQPVSRLTDTERRMLGRSARAIALAAGVATLLGTLSLVAGIMRWRARQSIDFEVMLGLADSIVVLTLAIFLHRRSRGAAIGLIALGIAGLIYAYWDGAPLVAAAPTILALIFYARALRGFNYIRDFDRMN